MVTTSRTTSYSFTKLEYVLTPEGWKEISPWSYLAAGLSEYQLRISKTAVTTDDLQKAMASFKITIKGKPFDEKT